MFNVDETRVVFDKDKLTFQRIGAASSERLNEIDDRTMHTASLLTVVSADGTVRKDIDRCVFLKKQN